MNNETIITVRDLIEVYSGSIIYIMNEKGDKLYHGLKYYCDLRLKLCGVSKFCFKFIESFDVLLIEIKELKNE